MFPYCNYVLAKRKDWAVQLMALLTKSRLEKEKIRTVTRSTVQLSVSNNSLAPLCALGSY